jgi:hypothetical protein
MNERAEWDLLRGGVTHRPIDPTTAAPRGGAAPPLPSASCPPRRTMQDDPRAGRVAVMPAKLFELS